MLRFVNISKMFELDGSNLNVLDQFNLSIDSGEFAAIVGPSGCGKSTLLRLTAGLDRPDAGQILLDEADLANDSTHDLGFVFQEAALLPWRTLTDNVAIGLEARGVPAARRRVEANSLLQAFGLGGFEQAYPYMLSGGMKARAAIARAYIVNPTLLLMDEPFAALDAQTREILQKDLSRYWLSSKRSVLFVTHSLEEALLLATRVIVLGRFPAAIKADYRLELPFPRDPSGEEFLELKNDLRSHLS